jgi:hypothetical protein
MDDETAARISDRLLDQARVHWLEFAVIVASANLLLALVLLGRIAVGHSSPRVVALSGGIAAASVFAVVLAYYSIQVGALMVFGPLRLTQVVSSFLIAASQLALFLWPVHVLGVGPRAEADDLGALRQWLLFYAAFAFAATATNWHEARLRARRDPPINVSDFEDAQRGDRRGAVVSGFIVLSCWVLTFWLLLPAAAAGVAWAAGSSLVGMASQARILARLPADMDP